MTDQNIKHLIAAFTVALEQVLAKANTPPSAPAVQAPANTQANTQAQAPVVDAERNRLDAWVAGLSTERKERGGKLYRSEQQRAQSRYALLLRGIKQANWDEKDLRDALSLSRAHLLYALDNRVKPASCPWKIPSIYIERARALRKQ